MPTILICGSFWTGSLEESYAKAFETNGWKVDRFDIPVATSNSLLARVHRRVMRSTDSRAIFRSLLDRVTEPGPDVMFVIKGLPISAAHLRTVRLRLRTRPMICFNPDSPWEKINSSPQILESIEIYDHHFTWSERLIPSFYHYQAKAAHYLPFAYDPTLHFPLNEPRTDEFDAVFVGTYDRKRDKLLAELVGCKIGIWGNGWEKARYVPKGWIQSEAVYGEAATRLLSSSVCALNILRPQNEGSHNMRTFEIPATRNAMITTRSEEQSRFFTDGKEMLSYANPVEMRGAIQLLRKDPELAERIRNGAHKRVKGETYAKRAAHILTVLGMNGGLHANGGLDESKYR